MTTQPLDDNEIDELLDSLDIIGRTVSANDYGLPIGHADGEREMRACVRSWLAKRIKELEERLDSSASNG